MPTKKLILIGISLAVWLGYFAQGTSVNALQKEDEMIHADNANKAELNASDSDQEVIPVGSDDVFLNTSNSNGIGQHNLSAIENATATATGLISAGKTEGEVISALGGMGYTPLESQIAFAKASTGLSQQTNQVSEAEPDSVTTDTAVQATAATTTESTSEEAAAEDQTSLKPAADRVKEGVTPATRREKFVTQMNQNNENGTYTPTDKEISTVKNMLSEGYTNDEIAQGFVDNGYSTAQVSSIFNKSGVSASDTYSAVSKIAISEAEAGVTDQKPTAKFKTKNSDKWEQKWQSQQDAAKNQAKQDAILSTVNEMKAAGYEIDGALDTIVSDLESTGMSAQEVKDALIEKVADGKPRTKFKGQGSWIKAWISNSRQPQMTSAGEGEIALATAMINAGYSKEEVQAIFEKSGSYSYTADAVKTIMSGAQQRIDSQSQTQTQPQASQTTGSTQTSTLEDDINRRQTQANPI
jgi:hypothetical protein